eukprot:jgi/Bigna1/58389/fgenesh1_pm.83_\
MEEEEELGIDDSMVDERLRRAFPMAGIVGCDEIKAALLLGAVDNSLGGIAIAGRRGTAKSVLARGLHALLPPIEVVEESFANADPNDVSSWESGLADKLDGKAAKKKVRSAPFVTIPLGVTEDRLIGTVDIEESTKLGKPVFQPGLLAEANRGVLYIDEINLLDDGIVNLLLSVLSDGVNVVEREGISIKHPCKPLLIATFNPEEGDVRDHLLDRIAVVLNSEEPKTSEERLEAMDMASRFQDDPMEIIEECKDATGQMGSQILFAREFLKEVTIGPKQIEYLVDEARRGGVEGHRAEMFAVRVAKANAALEGRTKVVPEDLQKAVKLVIIPRSIFKDMPPEEMEPPQPPPPPPPPQDEMQEEQEQEQQEQEEEDQEEEEEPEMDQVPEEFVFDSEGVILDDDLMKFQNSNKASGRTGRARTQMIFSEDRGRYIKPMIPKGKVKKMAVDATLRAAAPYQRARRERGKEKGDIRNVYVESSDFRAKKLARKAGSLVIFCVDASGSMALNRMSSAKGAIINLLSESYTSRDKVALIPFYANKAEVLLPPSKSVAMATNRLETLPCGGGSPLAHALEVAMRTGLNAMSSGDTSRVMVVCVTDGRANVPLGVSNEDPEYIGEDPKKPTKDELNEEVLEMAKQVGALGMQLLVIDSENQFVSTGITKKIAEAAQGKYYYLPNANENTIAASVSDALADAKNS